MPVQGSPVGGREGEEMSMKTSVQVRFISGRIEDYEIEVLASEGATLEARLQKFMEAPYLAFRVGDELVFVPSTAIESISVVIPEEMRAEVDPASMRQATRL